MGVHQRRSRGTARTNGIYKNLFLFIFGVGGLIYFVHPGHSKVEKTAVESSSPDEHEPKNKKQAAHLRRQPSDMEVVEEVVEKGANTEPEVENPMESSEAVEKSDFEKEFEQSAKDRDDLDMKIAHIKDEVNLRENSIVNEVMKGKLEKEMRQSEERLKEVMDKYLESKNEDEETIQQMEEKMISSLEEKLRNEIFQAAEVVVVEKSNDIDQVVLEDVVDGMSSRDIEKDVEELEINILEDLGDEIKEAEESIEKHLNATVHQIEIEVIKEVLDIDVDEEDLNAVEADLEGRVGANKPEDISAEEKMSVEDEEEK